MISRCWASAPAAAALLLLLGGPAPALAHAIIIDSTPVAGGTVSGPEVSIELHFNSRIDHRRSRLTLYPPDGAPRTLAQSTDVAPDVVAARATGLAAGDYRLRWQVLAVDGHITRGDIPFKVVVP
jgi:copper resistance protein C